MMAFVENKDWKRVKMYGHAILRNTMLTELFPSNSASSPRTTRRFPCPRYAIYRNRLRRLFLQSRSRRYS